MNNNNNDDIDDDKKLSYLKLQIGGLYEFTSKTNWVFGPYICLDIREYADRITFEMLHIPDLVKESWLDDGFLAQGKITKLD